MILGLGKLDQRSARSKSNTLRSPKHKTNETDGPINSVLLAVLSSRERTGKLSGGFNEANVSLEHKDIRRCSRSWKPELGSLMSKEMISNS